MTQALNLLSCFLGDVYLCWNRDFPSGGDVTLQCTPPEFISECRLRNLRIFESFSEIIGDEVRSLITIASDCLLF